MTSYVVGFHPSSRLLGKGNPYDGPKAVPLGWLGSYVHRDGFFHGFNLNIPMHAFISAWLRASPALIEAAKLCTSDGSRNLGRKRKSSMRVILATVKATHQAYCQITNSR